MNISELIARRVCIDSGTQCWNWPSAGKRGYATVRVDRKPYLVHRLSYEAYIGRIPEGLEIDHLCRNRRCCNPDHLEPVTRAENVRRGIGPALLGALNSSKTHCAHGHPFDKQNTRLRPTGGRSCRACARLLGSKRIPKPPTEAQRAAKQRRNHAVRAELRVAGICLACEKRHVVTGTSKCAECRAYLKAWRDARRDLERRR